MATEKAALRVSELDFDSIRENLKTYLRAQSEFTDYDFDGSGMSILLDILAYNTHYMAYYLNMVGNEMFLDSAQLRSSILSLAKSINYVPGSSKGALAKVNIKITPSATESQNTNTITLGKYTKLLGSDLDGINYPFVALYSNTITKSNGAFSISNVHIKQGETITLQYQMTPTNTTRRFEIPSANVDTDTIVITVQESSSNSDTHAYTLATDITEITGNSKVFFIEENENLNYTFYFGDDVLGKKPKNGNIIICTYIDNVGSVANNIDKFTFIEPIAGMYQDNVITTAVSSSYGGVDKEAIEQVRFRAPYFYTSQNRAVIPSDYETLLVKDYNYIDSLSVWGGEDNDPVIYGKVFISIKTKGNYQLTNFEKENIKESLIKSRNVLTVIPEIINPDYLYVIIKGKVYFDSALTSLSAGELSTLIKAAIHDYADLELNKFNSVFRKSRLQSYIENAEKSITGSDIDIYIQKRFAVDLSKTKTYTLYYNTPLSKSTNAERLSSFPEIEIYDSGSVSRKAFIEEVPAAQTGINSIEITNSGINYTAAPTITIIGDGSGASASATVVGGRVISINVTNPGQNYTSALISITGGGGSDCSASAKLQSDIGTLRSVYYKSNGEKVVINSNIGTIDYTLGKITLNTMRIYSISTNSYYNDDELAILAPADADSIYPLRNRILSLDENDPLAIQLDIIAES